MFQFSESHLANQPQAISSTVPSQFMMEWLKALSTPLNLDLLRNSRTRLSVLR